MSRQVGDYLEKVKVDGRRASILIPPEVWKATVGAGLPGPPIDNTADIRARVPEEMLPPVVIADNNVDFEDFEGGLCYCDIVSQAFRDAVESLDKDVHQFVPVEVRRPDCRPHDKRPFYFMRVTRLLDTINIEASPNLQRVGGQPSDPITDTTTFHTHRSPFAVHADRIEGMGLWRDKRGHGDLFASQKLIDLLKARSLTGWAADSTFTEL